MWRLFVTLLLVIIVSGADITFNTGDTKTAFIHVGSFVIPNDANWQNSDSTNPSPYMEGTYNRKVYGLINRLVRNNVPVWYVNKSNKTLVTQSDSTVEARAIHPSDMLTGATNITLSGGYFIVPRDFTEDAWVHVNSFGKDIRVWNVTTDYTENDVRYSLTTTPKIGLLRGATTVDTQKVESYFQELGYALNTDWDELDNNDQIINNGAAGNCYTLLVLPRTTLKSLNSNASLSINSTIYSGLNAMALSDSIYNLESVHAYVYKPGEIVVCSSSLCNNVTTTDLSPSATFTTFLSDPMCTLSERSDVLAFIGTLKNTTTNDGVESGIIATISETDYKYATYAKITTANTPGGYIYYATGDSWDKCGIERRYDNSLRLIGNALLTPAAPHTGCNFQHSFAPSTTWDTYTIISDGTCYDLTVLDNDYDADDITLFYSNVIITPAAHSYVNSVTLGNSSIVVCAVNSTSMTGIESINYRVLDSDNNTSIETTIYVLVLASGTAIAPNSYDVTVTANNANDILYMDVLLSTTDPKGNADDNQLIITALPSEGSASVVNRTFHYPDNPFRSRTKEAIAYTPSLATVNGTVIDIVYKVHSVHTGLDSLNSTIRITVLHDLDGAPNAVDDRYSILQNAGSLVMNVIENDSNLRNNFDGSLASILVAPSFGGVSSQLNGTFTFTHNIEQSGNTSFIYQICKNSSLCSNATVYIQVIHVDHAPVTPDQTFYVYTDATSIQMAVLTNVTDLENNIDGSTLLVPSVTQYGITTIVNQTYVYYTSTSLTNVATDSFTYYVCDVTALCSMGTINVVRYSKVYPVNDIIYYYLNGSQVCTDVSQNDISYSNNINPNTTQLLSNSTIGTLVNENNGNICFAYTGNSTNIDEINYQICSTNGHCATGILYLIPSDDCNLNGIADSVDISNGTSKDCNNNGIPDECDVNYYGSEDCNGDGVPDSCQSVCANIEYA